VSTIAHFLMSRWGPIIIVAVIGVLALLVRFLLGMFVTNVTGMVLESAFLHHFSLAGLA